MDPLHILYWEGLATFAIAAIVLSLRALLRKNILLALVQNQHHRTSPTQLQFLLLTLAFAANYLWLLATSINHPPQAMPHVNLGWLVTLSASSALYLSGKYAGPRRTKSQATAFQKEG
jgi:hypothetical protein